MQDMRKTKKQLVDELQELRQQLAQVENQTKTCQSPDKQLLISLANQMHEPTVILDEQGQLLYGNDLAAKVIEVDSKDELAGMSLAAIVHPDSIEQAAADLQSVLESKADFSASYKLLVNGNTVHIESHGTMIELSDGIVDLVSFRDVSDRRKKEDQERANELILRNVLDHSSTVVFIKDTAGKYLLVNKRFEELFGVCNDEIIGLTDFHIFPADAAEQFQAKDKKAIEAGGPIEEEELVPHEDGPHTYISVKFPMCDSEGKAFATCGIATDITERKQAEVALATHHDQLEERVAERTRELTEVNRRLREEIADRKHAEEQAAIFLKFAESSGQGFGMADLQGKTTYLNPAACRFLGLSGPEEGIGQEIINFHPQDKHQLLAQEVIPAALEKGGWVGEIPLLHKDGHTVPTILSMFPICDEKDNPQVIAAVLTDISDRKKAQDSLEESERKFRSLAESTTAHISIIQDDNYVYANQAFLDYFGLDLEDLKVITPDDMMMGILGPKMVEQAMPAWEAAQERGDNRFGFEFEDLEGNWFQTNVAIMELDGKESYMSTNFDITEHKLAQQKVAENEKRYRTIFDTAGTGMISFGKDGLITLANEEWAKLTGYSLEEIVGKLTWVPFFTEQSLARMKKYHEMRSKDPSSVPKAYEAQCVDRLGEIHEGIINIQVVPGTQQRVASFQDMTALKRAQNEMYRADKMAALGQIIAGVAHEINNPNNFIYFNLPILRQYMEAIAPLLEQCLEKKPDLKILNMPYREFMEDVFKLLQNMEHGSSRITSIVSDLKTYVRSDEDQDRKPVSVALMVDRVMTLIGKQVRKMVKRLDVELAEGLPSVMMNAGKIEQVLINLLINAGHAADKEDSFVKVSARTAADMQNWVEIRIEDNGAGIPEDKLEQIFEPFYTSKGPDQGTGLGLSISHRIIEEHRGKLQVESQTGKGSCFTVLLPSADEK